MKQMILYDIGEDVFPMMKQESLLFHALPTVKDCVGCFSCWIKTPGSCCIKDRCNDFTKELSSIDKLIIISPITYGGYSRNIKAVLDRSIGYLLPYFRTFHKETHHQMRYDKQFAMHVYFYGPCEQDEKEVAKQLVDANALNLNTREHHVHFYNDVKDVYEVLL